MTRQELKLRLLNDKYAMHFKDVKESLKQYHSNRQKAKYIVLNDLNPFEEPKCPHCSKSKKHVGKTYLKTCGDTSCIVEQRKKMNLEKYGVEHASQSKAIRDKVKQTNNERYGVDNPFQAEEIKDKIKQINLEKYGVEYSFQREDVKDKIKETNLERYGVEYPMQSKDIQQTLKQNNIKKYGKEYYFQTEDFVKQYRETNLERYGVDNPMKLGYIRNKAIQTNREKYGFDYPTQNPKVISKIKGFYQTDEYYMKYLGFTDPTPYLDGTSIHSIAKRLGVSRYILRNLIKTRGIEYEEPSVGSSLEDYIGDILDNNNIEYIPNSKKIITPYELDFYIPEHNIAIEMNGVYWHSHDVGNKVDKNYHQMKFNRCKDLGITLIQITDIEIKSESEKWKNLIRSKLGLSERVYARKTKVISLTNEEAKSFTNDNHIQGHRNSSNYIGLEYEDNIVVLMSFSKHKEYDWELIRFCSKNNVVGGFSKLLKHFRKHNPGSIFSYSNSNFSIGDVYSKNGFEYLGQTAPSYYWTNGYDIKSRYEVQKYKIGYTETEVEYMTGLGYYRYFDAGNERWVLK